MHVQPPSLFLCSSFWLKCILLASKLLFTLQNPAQNSLPLWSFSNAPYINHYFFYVVDTSPVAIILPFLKSISPPPTSCSYCEFLGQAKVLHRGQNEVKASKVPKEAFTLKYKCIKLVSTICPSWIQSLYRKSTLTLVDGRVNNTRKCIWFRDFIQYRGGSSWPCHSQVE